MRISIHAPGEPLNSCSEVALAHLLTRSFDDCHQGRLYFKQLPLLRFLAWDEAVLVGAVGIDYRVIRIGEAVLPIAGIVDLCVLPHRRGEGIGAALLEKVEAASQSQDFIVAMADDHRLYKRCGYELLVEAQTRWLAIEDRRSHSIIERDLADIFMLKALSGRTWPDGKIDLLGYLF